MYADALGGVEGQKPMLLTGSLDLDDQVFARSLRVQTQKALRLCKRAVTGVFFATEPTPPEHTERLTHFFLK